ncbi:MAG TPA: hypothetical protein VMQ65_10860 [Candidatus Limnocylindria bacterium]|nr:hypothetical protein [Candidatus Limnocylindria bacterium]
MILRVIRGQASPEQLETLRAALQEKLGAAVREQAGLVTFHLGARQGDGMLELAFVSLWDSPEAVTSSDARGRTALSIATAIGLEGLEVIHFEIDAPIRDLGSSDVVAVRIARGEFSKPGADIETLNMLRERVPLLGDEMAEAYVGRRLVGRAVELCFVSVWRKMPGLTPLESMFWPDIAIRYDRLAIDVFKALGSAPGMG